MIECEGEQKYLGSFNDEVDAARVYDEMALKNYGEFAFINEKEIGF